MVANFQTSLTSTDQASLPDSEVTVQECGNNLAVAERPSFKEALRFWFELGWISFGGTAAHIAIMHENLVEKKRWISNASFLHALSHCMILPGPEAQQLAIYIGWKLHGKRGGVVAGTLFVLPSMFVLLALSVIYVRFGNLPWIAAMFRGSKPAVVALVVVALHRVAKRAVHGPVQSAIAVAAFVGMYFFDLSLLLVMFSAVALGVALGWLQPRLLHLPNKANSEKGAEVEDEEGYCISLNPMSPDSPSQEAAPLVKPAARLTAIVLLLWLLPLAAFYLFVDDFHFWKSLVMFFTRTAFVTIGGSYTVIPYVAHVTVEQLHWLSRAQMMDGFALAETTPGPLIIVVAFVGFMAGYNHFHGSLWMGPLALLATSFYIFLPCFLFVFAGAPLVERTQNKPVVQGVLGFITAVVLGAILNLTLFLGKAVIFPLGSVALRQLDAISLGWVIVSFVLLRRLKVSVIQLIPLSIAFGLIRYCFGL